MTDNSGTHFDVIARQYKEAAQSWQCVYDQAQCIIDPLISGKTVLDIGNGGVFPYDVSLAERVCVVDLSHEMLLRGRRDGVDFMVADALDLAAFKDACADVILYVLCVHHINGRNLSETLVMLDRLFTAACRVLKSGGSIVVVEPVMRGIVYGIEKTFFPVMRRLLGLRGVDMVFFHARETLIDSLAQKFSKHRDDIVVHPFALDGYIDPLGGSGLVKIPVQLYPATFSLFHLRKA